jgi:uncharacterized protein YbaR (Trm112 family)
MEEVRSQQLDYRLLSVLCCPRERRPFVLVLRVDVDLVRGQQQVRIISSIFFVVNLSQPITAVTACGQDFSPVERGDMRSEGTCEMKSAWAVI